MVSGGKKCLTSDSLGKKITALALEVKGILTVPLPGLMKMVVTPVIKLAFEKITDEYVDNLATLLGGEA